MKKVLLFLFILLLAFGGYLLYDNYFNKGIPKLDVEEEKIDIDKLYIYGTHLNLNGKLVSDVNLDLVLYNGDFKSYKINGTDSSFNLSDNINDGIDLENIPVGKYYVFLRSTSKDEEDNDVYRYYVLNNTTSYKETTYYTFSNNNSKIVINTDDYYETLMLNVTENDNDLVYDVVIDPGHGGMDSGANKNGKREADYTMKIAESLKTKLEDYGIKVKLTRTSDQLTLNETLPDYGTHGRSVIGHEVYAKYIFSIHLNSNSATSVRGLEIYTPANINYDFIKTMAKTIVTNANANYSTNRINKVSDGIYTRTFTEADVKSSIKENEERGRKPYDVSVGANYYFMIRETGGIMTGAYVDDRNAPKVLENPYYKSNVGCEAYLFELGYLTNNVDMENINNNMDKYTQAIASTFNTVYTKYENQN